MFDLEKERELFEAWAYSNKWNTFKVSFMNDDIEKYADDFVEGAWHGWIQSAQREGYKLVPVETLNRTLSHISTAMCHPMNTIQEENTMQIDMDIIEEAMLGVSE